MYVRVIAVVYSRKQKVLTNIDYRSMVYYSPRQNSIMIVAMGNNPTVAKSVKYIFLTTQVRQSVARRIDPTRDAYSPIFTPFDHFKNSLCKLRNSSATTRKFWRTNAASAVASLSSLICLQNLATR